MSVVVDHTAQAAALLVSQFQSDNVLKAFISAITDELQELEFAIQQVKYLTRFDFANGVQLDRIGDALDQARVQGEDDPDYLDNLRIAIIRNTADGTPNTAIRYIAAVTKASYIQYFETPPRSPNFAHNGATVVDLIKRLRDMAPTGCGKIFLSQPTDAAPEEG